MKPVVTVFGVDYLLAIGTIFPIAKTVFMRSVVRFLPAISVTTSTRTQKNPIKSSIHTKPISEKAKNALFEFLRAILAAIVALVTALTASSCGATTRAVITNRADSTQTTVSITTNNTHIGRSKFARINSPTFAVIHDNGTILNHILLLGKQICLHDFL